MHFDRAAAKDEVGVECAARPPLVIVADFEDGEMEVRRVRRRVSGRADIAEDLALLDDLAFVQSLGVPLEVRVVVAEAAGGIELVDGDAPRLLTNSFAMVPSSTA